MLLILMNPAALISPPPSLNGLHLDWQVNAINRLVGEETKRAAAPGGTSLHLHEPCQRALRAKQGSCR